MRKLSDLSLYYIPTYITKNITGVFSDSGIIPITQQYLLKEHNIKQTKKINDADFILSDKPLSLTSKDVLLPFDIFELIELESRNTKWSIKELQELNEMLISKDINTKALARNIICGLNTNILKKAIGRGYLREENYFSKPYTTELSDYFSRLANTYISFLFTQQQNPYRKSFLS